MKYIIDTDPGIDDAIAIILGYLNKLDIIGFTLASGNVEEEKSENNLKVIQDFLQSNIKMYKGTIHNKNNYETAEYAHGKDGLGYLVFPKNKRKFEKMSAEDFIIKSSKKYKKDLMIVCFGPLTNLASALKKDPNLAKRIKGVLIMGTSYNPESNNHYIEFNVNVDPVAAKLVLSSAFEEIKLVTHEIGVRSFIEKEYVENLVNSDKLISRFIGLMSKKYIEFSYDHYKTIGLGTPDPTTMASLIDPMIIKYEPCMVDIVKNDEGKSECVISIVDSSNIMVSTDFDLERFRKVFKDTFN